MVYEIATVVDFEMLGNKVLVKPVEAKSETDGGILLPDVAQEETREGVVISVGPGEILDNGRRAEMQVKVGDKVLFEHYNTNNFVMGGEEYRIMFESSIMAILK